MKNLIIVILASALIVTSGLVTVNFYHNMVLPKELTSKSTIHQKTTVNTTFPFINKRFDIYMVDTMFNHKQVEDVVITLNEAGRGDEVVLHLAGYGGGVEQLLRIINSIRSSKAEVTTIVEAPVYSGHAFIALYGDRVIIRPFSYLMLHTTSGVDTDCSKKKGQDRGMTEVEVCNLIMSVHIHNFNKLVKSIPNVLLQDKLSIIKGKTILLINETDRDLVYLNTR